MGWFRKTMGWIRRTMGWISRIMGWFKMTFGAQEDNGIVRNDNNFSSLFTFITILSIYETTPAKLALHKKTPRLSLGVF